MAYKLLIGGQLETSQNILPVVDPSTEQIFADSPIASRDQLDRAVLAAQQAFSAWKNTPLDERRARLVALAQAVDDRAEELSVLLTREQGKPLAEARGEVALGSMSLKAHAQLALPGHRIESPGSDVELQYVPLGVVGAIAPWNFPFTLMISKIAAALLTGNTVVAKPAPTTPLTTLLFGEIAGPLLPPGTLNVVSGNNDLGQWMTEHPDIRKISFTGSTPTGRKVMEGAAVWLKRLTLELGGNDAAIVLPGTSAREAARKIFSAAFLNAGQVCIAIKRLYVHASIYDEVCDELSILARSVVVGPGLEEGVQQGPLQNRAQFERVLELIEDARDKGDILAGGQIARSPGFFIQPTIIANIDPDARIVVEEQFGPVLPVLRYEDVDDVISQVNASAYGLGASIWGPDTAAARELANELDVGTVWINKHLDLRTNIPFAGAKQSGFGAERGTEGLAEYMQIRVVNS